MNRSFPRSPRLLVLALVAVAGIALVAYAASRGG
jgi:hypothetical protein